MGAILAELAQHLDLHEPRPPRFQTFPTPQEAIAKLYADNYPAQFFLDANPSVFRPHVNRNIHPAMISIINALNGPGIVGSIEGSMGAGKTTLIADIAKAFSGRTQVFKHTRDSSRLATDNLTTQAETGGYDTGIPAQTYHSTTDLLDAMRFNPGTVALVDEWQFADPIYLQNLIDTASTTQTRLIFATLNTDFARRPWENLQLLAPQLDLCRIVLAARCSTEGCRSPALFTTRQVTLPDGRTRPAHTDEPTVQIGSVADAYFPTCAVHHQVLQPKDARLLDAGHEPEDTQVPGTSQTTTFWFRH